MEIHELMHDENKQCTHFITGPDVMPYAEVAACFPMCKSPYVIIGLTEQRNSANFKCTNLYLKPEIRCHLHKDKTSLAEMQKCNGDFCKPVYNMTQNVILLLLKTIYVLAVQR